MLLPGREVDDEEGFEHPIRATGPAGVRSVHRQSFLGHLGGPSGYVVGWLLTRVAASSPCSSGSSPGGSGDHTASILSFGESPSPDGARFTYRRDQTRRGWYRPLLIRIILVVFGPFVLFVGSVLWSLEEEYGGDPDRQEYVIGWDDQIGGQVVQCEGGEVVYEAPDSADAEAWVEAQRGARNFIYAALVLAFGALLVLTGIVPSRLGGSRHPPGRPRSGQACSHGGHSRSSRRPGLRSVALSACDSGDHQVLASPSRLQTLDLGVGVAQLDEFGGDLLRVRGAEAVTVPSFSKRTLDDVERSIGRQDPEDLLQSCFAVGPVMERRDVDDHREVVVGKRDLFRRAHLYVSCGHPLGGSGGHRRTGVYPGHPGACRRRMLESGSRPTPHIEKGVFSTQPRPADDCGIALRAAIEEGIHPGFQRRPPLDIFTDHDPNRLGMI